MARATKLLLAPALMYSAMFGMSPAVADCTVNLGTCDTSSSCVVNVGVTGVFPGECTDGGACTVNFGTCTGGDHDPEWAGFTCGFASTNDPTGVVNQDPNAQTGVMNTGIMLASDLWTEDGLGLLPDGPVGGLTAIRQHCWIQVNQLNGVGHPPNAVPIPTAHCDFDSLPVVGTVLLPQGCTIAYSAGPTDNVYQCTSWEFTHSAGTSTYYWDDVPGEATTAPNEECSLAVSAGA